MTQTEVEESLGSRNRATRGHGLLEPFLARRRYKMAQSLIPQYYRKGCVVDIGCGALPLFLASTDFAEKIGLDKSFSSSVVQSFASPSFRLIEHDIEKVGELPLADSCCDVVTMLAVIEHIERQRLERLFTEVYRILKPGGAYIITTPAPWTDRLLSIMARLKLVSSAEIDEHKGLYYPASISAMLVTAGFSKEKMRSGYFELGLNVWAVAIQA